jgi:hypothetical protein
LTKPVCQRRLRSFPLKNKVKSFLSQMVGHYSRMPYGC